MDIEEIKKIVANKAEMKQLIEVYTEKAETVDAFYDAAERIYLKKQNKVSWLGFLFGPFYLFYHRLYKFGLVLLGLQIIIALLFPSISRYISLAVTVTCFTSFYFMYFYRFFNFLEHIGYREISLAEVKERIKGQGKIDKDAIIAFVIIFCLQIYVIMQVRNG